MGQSRGRRKNIYLGSPDVVLVHPQNGLNSLILNWCIGGCWFTPAQKYDLGSMDSMCKRYNLRFTRLTLMCGLYKNQDFQMVFKNIKLKFKMTGFFMHVYGLLGLALYIYMALCFMSDCLGHPGVATSVWLDIEF